MLSAEPLRLDLLPVEIICRILASGPCTNALTLSRVNKALRALSTTPLVYQQIVESGNGIHESSADSQLNEPGTWWVDQGLDHTQDWRVSAKWALADLKARELFFRRKWSDYSLVNLLPFLPELLSKNHCVAQKVAAQEDMFGNRLCEGTFRSRQTEDTDQEGSQPNDIDMITRAAFVYACGCTLLPMSAKEAKLTRPMTAAQVGQQTWTSYLPSVLGSAITDFLPSPTMIGHGIWKLHMLMNSGPVTGQDLSRKESELHWLQCATLCTLMAGMMHRRLEIVIANRGFIDQRYGRILHHNMRPPAADNIPFGSVFRNTSPPFTVDHPSNGTSAFITRHIPNMTSSDFLTDGEWIGYYNYSWSQGIPRWDPIMHGIFFEVTADHPDHKEVKAIGTDGIGDFTLEGQIYTTTGWVRVEKAYVGRANRWTWAAVMTPFGIIGGWGQEWGGSFWLWKKAWSERIPATEPPLLDQ